MSNVCLLLYHQVLLFTFFTWHLRWTLQCLKFGNKSQSVSSNMTTAHSKWITETFCINGSKSIIQQKHLIHGLSLIKSTWYILKTDHDEKIYGIILLNFDRKVVFQRWASTIGRLTFVRLIHLRLASLEMHHLSSFYPSHLLLQTAIFPQKFRNFSASLLSMDLSTLEAYGSIKAQQCKDPASPSLLWRTDDKPINEKSFL